MWVDGKNTGSKTPVPQTQPIELPVGKHKVIFKLDGKSSPPVEIDPRREQGKPPIVSGEL